MTNFSLSNIEFEENLFKKLNMEIRKSTQSISYIAVGGVNKGEAYQRATKKFSQELENGLDETTLFTWHEILYITNELATNKSFFNTLMEYEEFDTFVLLIKKYEKLSIYKKLFNIYFNYYSTLNKEGAMSVLKMYLKRILRNYKGKNRYINNLVSVKEHVFGNLPDLLEYYDNDFEAIKVEMKLQDAFEFSKALLNLKILQDLKLLKYDEDDQNIFSRILDRKDMYFDKGLSLKEYVVKELIDRALKEKQPFPSWQVFILKLIGDPRSTAMYSATMGSWNIIGENRKEFFIKALSRDDLKLFLEALSDSVSDTNYHYRKSFWMQFLDKVIFTKIMAGRDAYIHMNDEMRKKFELNNDSYSRLTGNHSQSAIYIDFGKIKVIEFTHNGKARFYNNCPIDLDKKEFTYSQFLTINSFLIKAITHNGAKSYSWQKNALKLMNEQLNINISKKDVEIPEDKKKREMYSKKHPFKKNTNDYTDALENKKTKKISKSIWDY